ncbi:MAG: LL-diaminopimelate aminotransferase [Thermaerobacter sp.]|jgi:LL-diaminopimelate aminotransferase|nr:LL-diaminopimelate aminotransferase [Thermaerobacter sp.]
MRQARRIERVPPYHFAQIDRKKAAALARGVDVINLGIGDPDRPSPPWVVEEVCRQARDPANHRYPDYDGLPSFREAVAAYYERRFGVSLDPAREVLTLIGSKEGLAHLVWALVDPGDVALVPDPAYPVYRTHTLLAGGTPYSLPLRLERGFLPDLAAVPVQVARRAKVLFLNYPNNPTGAVADREFLARAVDFCRRHDLVLAYDNAYAEMTFDGYTAPSILELPGAREVAVEFYSLSKPFNMTGWRIAACVGNAEVIRALGVIKTNTDSGQWNAVQRAGIAALGERAEAFIAGMREVYRRRRDVMVEGLRRAGWEVPLPRATFYLWARVPEEQDAGAFAERLLEEAGVVVTPGPGFGEHGAGFVRLALTVEEVRLAEAARRIARVLGR